MPLIHWIQENLQSVQPSSSPPQPASGSAGNGGGWIGAYVNAYVQPRPAETWRISGKSRGEDVCSASICGDSFIQEKIVCRSLATAFIVAIAEVSATGIVSDRARAELRATADLVGGCKTTCKVRPAVVPISISIYAKVSISNKVFAIGQVTKGDFLFLEVVKPIAFGKL